MTRFALQNYIDSFRWSHIKEALPFSNFFMPLYSLCIIELLNADSESFRPLSFLLFALPVIVAMITASFVPSVRLPKILFLCPMTQDMRREYITRICCIRTLVPILLSLFAAVISFANAQCDSLSTAGMLLQNILFALFTCSGVGDISGFFPSSPTASRTTTATQELYMLSRIIMILCALLLPALYATTAREDALWIKLLPLALSLLLSLPITVHYLKKWHATVENALSYETY